MEVIPDTEYSDIQDEIFVPLVEMLRTLAHLAHLVPASCRTAGGRETCGGEDHRGGAHGRSPEMPWCCG
eukprot:484827-Pyramimonas_sp.AAC.1